MRTAAAILLALAVAIAAAGCGASQAMDAHDREREATDEAEDAFAAYVEADAREEAEVDAARAEVAVLRREVERLKEIIRSLLRRLR